jgi:hypothetical protein
MRTAVTVVSVVQVGIDEFRNVRTTKIFDDDTTLGDIKRWEKEQLGLSIDIADIRLSGIEISDVV